ncbi:MAG: hypothetical protein Q8L46_02615, partial [candidate division WWE3 bacterium]|nr:hypothetical protein [candidate division WWE3 bacterium]
MLDPKFVLENLKEIKKTIAERGMKVDVEGVTRLAKARMEILVRVEKLRAQRNQLTRSTGAQAFGSEDFD